MNNLFGNKKNRKSYQSMYSLVNLNSKKGIESENKEYCYDINSNLYHRHLKFIPCDRFYVATFCSDVTQEDISNFVIDYNSQNPSLFGSLFISLVIGANFTRKCCIVELQSNDDNLFNSSHTFIDSKDRSRCISALRQITWNEKTIFLNVIPSFYEDNGKPLHLKRVRYFLPDECTVQLNETGLRNLEVHNNRSSNSEISHHSLLSNNHSSLQLELHNESQSYPIICKQLTPGYFTIDISADSHSRSLFDCLCHLNNSSPDVCFAEPSEVAKGNYNSKLSDIKTHHTVDRLIENHKIFSNWALHSMKMRGGWNFHRGKSRVIIAVIDDLVAIEDANIVNPVRLRNPAFNRSKLSLYDFCSNADSLHRGRSEDSLFRENQHGTQMVGLICGIDEDQGFLGIAPKCEVMSLGVNLGYGFVSAIVDAINYVIRLAKAYGKNHYIINCSWHIIGRHQGLLSAIDQAAQMDNICIVAAAGNFKKSKDPLRNIAEYPIYPASALSQYRGNQNQRRKINPEKYVITVTSTTIEKAHYEEGGFGSGIVDVGAPGDAIVAPINDTYGAIDGTSASTAFVSGLVALMWSVSPELSPRRIKENLKTTCTPYKHEGNHHPFPYGRGVVNAEMSLAKSVLSLPISPLLILGSLVNRLIFLLTRLVRLIYITITYGLLFRSRTIVGLLVNTFCPKVMNSKTLGIMRVIVICCLLVGIYISIQFSFNLIDSGINYLKNSLLPNILKL